MPPWKRLSSENILKTSLFDVMLERSICPRTQKGADFLTFKFFGDWVNVVALAPGGKLVMIRQFRHGTKKFELEIPGGLIDRSDKNPVEAGRRELLEETGYEGLGGEIIGTVSPNPALQGNLCHTVFFHAARKTGRHRQEETEDIKTILTPVGKLDALVASGKIRHALVVAALLFFKLKLQ